MTIRMSMLAAGLAAALLAVAGCTPTGGPTSALPTPSPTASQSVSTTPSPTALTPDEQDLVTASAAYAKFVSELDRLSADPDSRINDLDQVARGGALDQAKKDLLAMRVAGYRLTGATVIDGIKAKLSPLSRFAGPSLTLGKPARDELGDIRAGRGHAFPGCCGASGPEAAFRSCSPT